MRRTLPLLTLLLLAPIAASAAVGARTPRRPNVARMAAIPAGSYRPLYRAAEHAAGDGRVRLDAFQLDRTPVTRGEYLAFVRDNPEWRRGSVSRSFAEASYLDDWRSDLDAGDAAALERPVTRVSWFAAKAYCEAQGKRLPTVDEWEYVAAASETVRDAARDPRFVRQLLASYAQRAPSAALPPARAGARNAYGVRGLHDLVWEWTLDFNPAAAPAHSHAAHVSAAAAHDHRAVCASGAIGAADPANYPAFMRYGVRAGLTAPATMRNLGFRCASAA